MADLILFRNRTEAGNRLAERLAEYADARPIILALPRGGVPVGYQVAQKLHAPLEVIVVRKIGEPNNPEFGIGAVAEGDTLILDQELIETLGTDSTAITNLISQEKTELMRRVQVYRGGRPLPSLRNQTIILVDDGLATGITARGAITAVKKQQPRQLILATPVGAADTVQALQKEVDQLVCLATPANFAAVGTWYEQFDQTEDEEVVKLLHQANTFRK